MQRSDEEIYEEQERRRIKARRERRRKRRKQQIIFRAVTFTVFFLVLLLIVMLVHKVAEKSAAEEAVVSEPVKYVEKSPDFAVELLTVNEYSRPGTELAHTCQYLQVKFLHLWIVNRISHGYHFIIFI